MHAASRRLTTAAEPPASTSSVVSSSPLADEEDDDATYQKRPRKGFIHTSVIVNRHPMLTRTPTAFERAYYAYHSRIERALHNPFPSEFYFKPGSLLEGKFDEEEKAREKEAFGHMPWLEYDQKKNVISTDLVNGEEAVKPMPRETEADRKGDVKSLDRKGERNLYLLTKTEENGKEVWKFPQTELVGEELPHEVSSLFLYLARYTDILAGLKAVKRDLRSPYGTGMDTWIVSRIPIGIYQPNPTAPPFEQVRFSSDS